MRAVRDRGDASIEPRAEAQDAFNARLHERMERTVWLRGGCSSWYLDAHGRNTTLWPGSSLGFRRALRGIDDREFHFEAPRAPAATTRHRHHGGPGMSFDLNGRTVLITGAARGIGAETAARLHARGANLALVGLEPDLLEQVAERLGDRAEVFVADVTDAGALERAVAGTVERFGALDVADRQRRPALRRSGRRRARSSSSSASSTSTCTASCARSAPCAARSSPAAATCSTSPRWPRPRTHR